MVSYFACKAYVLEFNSLAIPHLILLGNGARAEIVFIIYLTQQHYTSDGS